MRTILRPVEGLALVIVVLDRQEGIMFRVILAAAALAVSSPAFACADGNGDCDKSHCKMQEANAVETAMAAVDAADGTKLALSVEGMSCGSCSEKIAKALKAIEGVKAAAVSHADGAAKIAFDAEKIDAEKLMAAIAELGFKAKKAEA
jgi:copper chaperone CopZ